MAAGFGDEAARSFDKQMVSNMIRQRGDCGSGGDGSSRVPDLSATQMYVQACRLGLQIQG